MEGGGRGRPTAALGLSALLIASACVAGGPGRRSGALSDHAITVASFDFDESVLLGELYAQAIEGAGFRVERALEIGPRELVAPSLQRGLVEFVPEYLGTALLFLRGEEMLLPAEPEAARAELADELAGRGLRVLDAAEAQDANGFAVTEETAERYDLRTISDLGLFADELVFGGPPECPERPLCLEGLGDRYGLRFEEFVALDASGPVTAGALASGEVDVALLFTTSGYIADEHFVLLEDDLALQPPENVVPIVHADVIAEHGDAFVSAVDDVSALLTTEELASLNRSVSLVGRPVPLVAREWLASHGLAAGDEG